MLGEFVRHGWLEEDAATGIMSWPQSGFGAYLGPRVEEREGLLRVARYSTRAPVAESRLRYDAERAEVERVADRSDGPYAGVHRMTALEFLARWVDHVPERCEVRVRYAGAYATQAATRSPRSMQGATGSPCWSGARSRSGARARAGRTRFSPARATRSNRSTFSPEGKRAIVSVVDWLSGLTIAEGVPGIVPPKRKK